MSIVISMLIYIYIIGKQLDGIWHTGIVAYGQEWFFGGMGIESCPPVSSGTTQIPDTNILKLLMLNYYKLHQTTFLMFYLGWNHYEPARSDRRFGNNTNTI